VKEDWRKLHFEVICNLYFLPSSIRMIKSKIMKWAGQVECVVEKTNPYRVLVGKP